MAPTISNDASRASAHGRRLESAGDNCTGVMSMCPMEVDCEAQKACEQASRELESQGAQVRGILMRDANNIESGGKVLELTDEQIAEMQWS